MLARGKVLSRGRDSGDVTLHTLASVCKFSLLFSIHFLCYLQGELVWQSRISWVRDHFLYSRDLNVWFKCDSVGRNLIIVLIILRGLRNNLCSAVYSTKVNQNTSNQKRLFARTICQEKNFKYAQWGKKKFINPKGKLLLLRAWDSFT